MLDTNKTAIKNLFIVSASLSEKVDEQIAKLSFLARQARYLHDYSRMAVFGEELLNLSSRSEDAGRYYVSIAENLLGLSGFQKNLFEELSNRSRLPIRAASINSLARWSINSGKPDEAYRLYSESLVISSQCSAPVTRLYSIVGISELLSLKGSHRESLAILRTIHPAVCYWGRFFPLLLAEQYNNLAYELYKTGDLASAQYAINKACAMPIAKVCPQWFESKLEIDQKLQEKPSRHIIFTPADGEQPQVEPLETTKGGAKVMPFRQKKLEVFMELSTCRILLSKSHFETLPEAHTYLVSLLEEIEILKKDDEDNIVIRIKLVAGNELVFESHSNISELNLPRLLGYINSAHSESDSVDEDQPPPMAEVFELLPELRTIEVWFRYKTTPVFLQRFIFQDEHTAQDFLFQLQVGIDELVANDSEPQITIHTRLMENKAIIAEADSPIAKTNFDRLFEFFEDLRLMLEIEAESVPRLADEATVTEQTQKIMQMIEADESRKIH